MKRYYPVNSRNSTVCGYPGRGFDWSKFDWEGGVAYISTFDRKVYFSQPPCVDDCLIGENCQYLHVPYDWKEDCTVYRVRPNESMRAGQTYRGKLIIKQTAVKKDGKWYWCLDFLKES